MRRWYASNVPPAPSAEPNWKAIVRRVRDWLDSLLEEGGGRSVAKVGRNPSSLAHVIEAIHQTGEQYGVAPNIGDEEAKIARWNALRQQPPPEDWLRRVREGAPELLRLVEERQTGAASAPPEGTGAVGEMPAMSPPFTPELPIRADNPLREVASVPSPPVTVLAPQFRIDTPSGEAALPRFVPAARSFPQRRTEPTPSSAVTTTSRAIPWFRRLRWPLKISVPEQAAPERTLPEKRATSTSRKPSNVSVKAKHDRPRMAGEREANRDTLRPQATAASEPLPNPKSASATPNSRWTEVVRRNIRPVLLARLLPKHALQKLEVEHKNGKAVTPKGATSPTPYRGTAPLGRQAMQRADFSTEPLESKAKSEVVQPEADDASSQTSLRSISRPPLPHSGHSGSRPARRDTRIAPSWPSLHAWAPERGEAKSLRDESQAAAHLDASPRIEQKFKKSPDRVADCWPPLPPLVPELQEDDPWPALLDGRHRAADSIRVVRDAEHLRALDVEQRGGR